MRIMKLLLCVVGCMVASGVLYAQKQHVGSLDSIHTIKEVVVVGNNTPSVIPAQVMTGDELQRLNSMSVADACVSSRVCNSRIMVVWVVSRPSTSVLWVPIMWACSMMV